MSLKIFSGSSHPEFAASVCGHLNVLPGAVQSIVFSNDNRFVKIEEPVRGDDVFIIQTSSEPVDSHLIELLMLARTCRDASAERITVVAPYFPYVRSDKKDQPRVCIAARLVADLLAAAGASRALTMDLHSPQIQGFFSVPCDQLFAAPDIIGYLRKNWNLSNYVLVAGDAGAAKMLKIYADGLGRPVAIMDKRREGNDEQPRIKGVIGEVKEKNILLIDDEIASGRTMVRDAEFLLQTAGARRVDACVVHPVLGAGAGAALNQSPIERFVITNTVPTKEKALKHQEVVDVSARFAECIRRIHEHLSIKDLNEI